MCEACDTEGLVMTAAEIIAALQNHLAAEKAINAALNNQIESIQSDNLEETLQLEKTLSRYKSVNKTQAQAVDRLNGIIEDRLEDIRELTQKLANANNEWKYWAKTAEERLKFMEAETSTQDAISDLQAKSDSDEHKIASLQKEIEELKANPPIILDSASMGIITDLQEQVKHLNRDNENLRYRLRNIRSSVERHTKDV
jgi:chromosome segregation ATPase